MKGWRKGFQNPFPYALPCQAPKLAADCLCPGNIYRVHISVGAPGTGNAELQTMSVTGTVSERTKETLLYLSTDGGGHR